MKKLLGIVVLGLLCLNSFKNDVEASNYKFCYQTWNSGAGAAYITMKKKCEGTEVSIQEFIKIRLTRDTDAETDLRSPKERFDQELEKLYGEFKVYGFDTRIIQNVIDNDTKLSKLFAEKPKKQEPGKEQYEKYQVKLDNCITEDKNLKEKFVVYKHDYLINYKKDNVAVTAYRKPNKPYDDGSYKKVFYYKIASSTDFLVKTEKKDTAVENLTYYLELNLQNNRVTTVQSNNQSHTKQCSNKVEIAEKPKKKKPKSSPDDDKIVPAGSGSGFFVSKEGHAITNYHVIEGCDINKLSFKGSQTEVKVLAVDKVNDIAILKSNEKPDVIFPVSNEDVSLLEDVIVAGFPLGKQISSAIKTHKGVVTALAGAGDNYSFFQTDAAINQGNSGGPIINQKGNVVGIAVATWVEEGVQGVHFGIKSSTLKTFASANGLSFLSPNYRDQSNKSLGELITKGTVYVECHMTVAKIKKMIAQTENRKAFFKEHVN
ncbi:serine protease [Candidatus Pelagibacter sp.]|nr:serine protease [Candidatus Pelagibacter sp.]